jgi:hypothetical protein
MVPAVTATTSAASKGAACPAQLSRHRCRKGRGMRRADLAARVWLARIRVRSGVALWCRRRRKGANGGGGGTVGVEGKQQRPLRSRRAGGRGFERRGPYL